MARLVAAAAALLLAHPSCAQQSEPAPQDANVDADTDDCVSQLMQAGVTLQAPAPSQDIATPVQIDRHLGPLLLAPRGPYPALMDCSLALALQKAAPVFLALGLNELRFSAAYDHRTRRGSSQLSSHSFGRAIDVHQFDGPAGKHDVATDFEAGVGTWLGLVPHEGALDECIGRPLTARGRTLRALVCRLKLETELRIIVTPDDNEDHRDHIHLEYAPPYTPRLHAKAAPPPDGLKIKASLPQAKRVAIAKRRRTKAAKAPAPVNKVTKAHKAKTSAAPPKGRPKTTSAAKQPASPRTRAAR